MLPPDLVPAAIALLATACTLAVVILIVSSRVTGKSQSAARFAAIASPKAGMDRRSVSDESGRKQSVEATLRELEEKQRVRQGAKPSLVSRMRQAGLNWSKNTYYLVCMAAGVILLLIALGGLGISLLPALGFATAGGLLLPHLYVSGKRNRRFKSFADEFPNAVDVIVRGVKSGLPLVDCLRIISLEAQEPVRSEFKSILEDQTIGVPIDEAVYRLPERIPLAEANFFAIVIALQSRTGGSLSEALGNLSKVLRERRKMQAKIKAVSSEAKASAGIIGSLPVVLGTLVYLTSPDYISLLFTTMTGKFVLAACALWMGIGIIVMRKMINFDF